MATDTSYGKVEKFEDFLVTSIGDLPEIDTQAVTGDTIAVVAGGADGRLRVTPATSNDDDVGAVTLGALNWTAGDGDLWMEARLFLSSVTDLKFFVGFGDSIATADETNFDATADTFDILTQSDAIGIGFDNDATTKQLAAFAAKTDAYTVGQFLGAAYSSSGDILKINTALTLGCWLSKDRKSAQFFVNGKMVYEVNSATTLVGAVDLVPGVWTFEQGTACAYDIDYIAARKARSTT